MFLRSIKFSQTFRSSLRFLSLTALTLTLPFCGIVYAQPVGGFVPAGNMNAIHAGGGAGTGGGYAARGIATALLPNGLALVAGGNNGPNLIAETFDPSTFRFHRTANMDAPYGTAIALEDGTVLMACGGVPNGFDPSSQLHSSPAANYNPSSGTFVPIASMPELLLSCPATLLPGGSVLIAGGEQSFDFGNGPTNAALLYDPSRGSFVFTGQMGSARYAHTSTLLPNGLVLIAGGTQFNDGAGPSLSSAELYDPSTGKFSPTGSMAVARAYHTAVLLQNGQVLIAGGEDTSAFPSLSIANSAEIYDPKRGKFAPAGNMSAARFGHAATLLANGQVLITGGADNNSVLASAELYDPTTAEFLPTGSMAAPRQYHVAVNIGGNQVMVGGGFSTRGRLNPLSSAEVYQSP